MSCLLFYFFVLWFWGETLDFLPFFYPVVNKVSSVLVDRVKGEGEQKGKRKHF